MVEPTAAQRDVRDATELGIAIIAPAGCGKTEALALRVAGLLERHQVAAPQRVLVTTFSNRARDNIRERLNDYIPRSVMRDRVTVHNFHGFAARIFQAHANVIGLDPKMSLPDHDWIREECVRRDLPYQTRRLVADTLQNVKLDAIDDDEVLYRLQERGANTAYGVEIERQSQQLLTYDDLPRFAELILANDRVATLYQAHFACAIVDEFQDLTLQQMRIIQRVTPDRTTYAGDLAQGIYGFTGARPREVRAMIDSEVTKEVCFSESHRSSPAVLDMVNALNPLTGGQKLICAQPDSWPGGGLSTIRKFATVDDEAQWIGKIAKAMLGRSPSLRIAVMTRTAGRRASLDSLFAETDIPHYRWDDPILDTECAPIVRGALGRISVDDLQVADDPTRYLMKFVDLDSLKEPDTRKAVVEAIAWVRDLLAQDVALSDLRNRIKTGDSDTLLKVPGVHLLTGHVGKGQQFDWAFVAGVEEGVIPYYLAKSREDLNEEARVLSVMISRARHGVFLTHAEAVPDSFKRIWPRDPSTFLQNFSDVTNLSSPVEARDWLTNADWEAIAKR